MAITVGNSWILMKNIRVTISFMGKWMGSNIWMSFSTIFYIEFLFEDFSIKIELHSHWQQDWPGLWHIQSCSLWVFEYVWSRQSKTLVIIVIVEVALIWVQLQVGIPTTNIWKWHILAACSETSHQRKPATNAHQRATGCRGKSPSHAWHHSRSTVAGQWSRAEGDGPGGCPSFFWWRDDIPENPSFFHAIHHKKSEMGANLTVINGD